MYIEEYASIHCILKVHINMYFDNNVPQSTYQYALIHCSSKYNVSIGLDTLFFKVHIDMPRYIVPLKQCIISICTLITLFLKVHINMPIDTLFFENNVHIKMH